MPLVFSLGDKKTVVVHQSMYFMSKFSKNLKKQLFIRLDVCFSYLFCLAAANSRRPRQIVIGLA